MALLLLLVLVAFSGAVAKRSPTFQVEHSLDGGSSWTSKGTVTVKVAGGITEMRFQPAFAVWEDEQLRALVSLANAGDLYRVRVPASLPEEGEVVQEYAMISVAPCLVFTTHFKESYQLVVSTQSGVITGVVGLQNTAVKLRAPKTHFCDHLTARSPGDGTLAVAALPTPRKHTVLFGLALPMRVPVVPEDVFVGARQAADQPTGGPAQGPPPEEKTFFQKYWLVIVMAASMLLLGGGGPAEDPRRAQAQQGDAPRPTSGQAQKKSN